MKLLFCLKCQDVVKLWTLSTPRTCMCGESWGLYKDHINAEFGGPCLLLGFNNQGMLKALNQHQAAPELLGVDFNAFFIQEPCTTAKRIG